jgi:hypothetical protein
MGQALAVPIHVGPLEALCALLLGPSLQSPVLLEKLQIAPRLRTLMSSGYKKKDPR